MITLQMLIEAKLAEGKSLRRISKESGVEYTSVSNYYHHHVEPRGKNLGLLAKYFNVPFHALLENYIPEHQESILTDAQRRVAEAVPTCTDGEAQLLLDLIRTFQSRRQPTLNED